MRALLSRIRPKRVINATVALAKRFMSNNPSNGVERWAFDQSYLLLMQWGIRVAGGVA